MPQIGDLTPACWLDPLPLHPQDRWVLLGEDGFADQSALFFPERFQPTPQRLVLTATSLLELDNQIDRLRAMRRTRVRVDDGMHPRNNCLVLGVELGQPSPCVAIVGGTTALDVWEQECVVTVLIPSPALA